MKVCEFRKPDQGAMSLASGQVSAGSSVGPKEVSDSSGASGIVDLAALHSETEKCIIGRKAVGRGPDSFRGTSIN